MEPLEEEVPEEAWPPGEGKEGLLYGRHTSSPADKREHARSVVGKRGDLVVVVGVGGW